MDNPTCSVDGCENHQCNGRGWCWKHYTRWRRGQRIDDPTPLEQLTAGLDMSGGPDSCWEWGGRVSTTGYGVLSRGYVHRRMLSMVLGRELSAGEHALHHCDNPPCANPRHLFVGTNGDNMRDMVDKGRHGSRYYDLDVDGLRWLYERHVSPDRIADLFGVSAIVIRLRLDELGLPRRPAGRPTRAEADAADAALARFGIRNHTT